MLHDCSEDATGEGVDPIIIYFEMHLAQHVLNTSILVN